MRMQAKIFCVVLSLFFCLALSLVGCQSINDKLGNYYELDNSEVIANE